MTVGAGGTIKLAATTPIAHIATGPGEESQ
jgi:hypothetical protein